MDIKQLEKDVDELRKAFEIVEATLASGPIPRSVSPYAAADTTGRSILLDALATLVRAEAVVIDVSRNQGETDKVVKARVYKALYDDGWHQSQVEQIVDAITNAGVTFTKEN